jgi:probable rRNA maturation factor
VAVFVADEQEEPVDVDDLADLARHVLNERRVPPDMEVSLLLVDEGSIARLNEVHLGGSGPTDVLAFPIDEPGETASDVPAILGDVVLCPAVATAQAAAAGHSAGEELRLLTVHGLLHLLGMDHAEPAEEREMTGATDELLRSYREQAAGA